jgi:outer membrane protein
MKIRILTAVPLLCTLTLPVFAQTAQSSWVDQFLSRYKPPMTNTATAGPQQTADPTVQALIRSGALPLTVGDMVRLILENNVDITVNRLTPFERQYLTQSLFRPYEPTIQVSASVSRNTTPSASQLVGASALSELTQNYSVGYSQSFSTGTNYGVSFQLNRNSSNSFFNTFNPYYNGRITYSINQHLMRDGFGKDANMRQIRISQNNKSLSEIDFELQMIDLVTAAQQTYWDLVGAEQNIKIAARSLELAEKTLRDNRRQIEVGTLAPIDVVQAESEVAMRQEQVVVATYSEKQFQDQIKKVISRMSDPGLVLAKLNPIEAIRQPVASDIIPVEEAIRYALESRPELQQVSLALKSNEITRQYTKNQLLPVFDIYASYNQNGIGGTQTLRPGFGTDGVTSVIPGGVGDTFRQLFSYNHTGYAVGFNLQFSLTNKATQAEYSRLLTEQQIVESRRTSIQQQIALQVRNASTQVEMNRARIQTVQKALELARRKLDAEEKKFQLGTSEIFFVLQAQRDLTAAETSETQALVSYTKALVEYDRALGRTLKQNQIQIDKQLQASPKTPVYTGN